MTDNLSDNDYAKECVRAWHAVAAMAEEDWTLVLKDDKWTVRNFKIEPVVADTPQAAVLAAWNALGKAAGL